MLFQQQSFLVAGLSRSGVSGAEYLLSKGARVFLYDDVNSDRVNEAAAALERRGCVRIAKEQLEEKAALADILVISPGIPVDHPLPVSFKRAKKRILGETELAALALRCPLVAVTGTNGKTTTVTLLESIFKESGKNAVACGNIGRPMTSCLEELGEDGIAVAEISSFQLETLTSLRPHVAVLLNVTEDHLNRHYTFENYVYLKSRILKNCTESEYAILNYDDPTVREIGAKTKANIVWFSGTGRADACIAEGYFCFRGERVCPVSALTLEGEHNRMNTLAAIAAAKLFGVSDDVISRAFEKFRGVRHRIETVGTLRGVRFVDDSKSTNVDAAVKAVDSMKGESVILLGGKDKGYSYEPLFERMKSSSVVHAVICGENAFRVLQAALRTGYTSVTLVRNFDLAVRVAYLIAKEGQTVLLSPASASFDAFHSYEERGDRFREIFRELSAREEHSDEEHPNEEGTAEQTERTEREQEEGEDPQEERTDDQRE